MIADEFEPGALFGSEHNILGDVSFDPLDEALIDRLGKRLKNLLAFQREADKRDEVGEAAGLGSSFDFLRRDGGEGVPEAVFGPGGVLFAEFFLQLLEHRFGEPVAVRAAVEKLERGDLGFVLFDVVAERFDDLLGVLRRLLRRAGEEHAVAGDHVDHLLAGLMDLDQELAQRGIARQRGDGFLHEFGLRSLQVFLRRLKVLVFTFLGFGLDIVGIGRGEQSLRDLDRASGLSRLRALRSQALRRSVFPNERAVRRGFRALPVHDCQERRRRAACRTSPCAFSPVGGSRSGPARRRRRRQ